jgi:hypothetical protein
VTSQALDGLYGDDASTDLPVDRKISDCAVDPAPQNYSRRQAKPLASLSISDFRKLFSGFVNFCFTAGASRRIAMSSRPTRGAFRDRHKRGAGCGGREWHIDERAFLRTEKPCGPDTPTLVSSSRYGSADDGGQNARSTGESTE